MRPADIHDPACDFFADIPFTMAPSYTERRNRRRARFLILGMVAVIILTLSMYGFLLISGQSL